MDTLAAQIFDMTSNQLRVDVASAYRFHMYAHAAELERQGALGKLFTALPARYIPEVGKRRIESRPVRAGLRRALSRVSCLREPLARQVIADFDRWVGRQTDGNVFTTLSSFATNTMEMRNASGVPTVCDRGSWHILEQAAVLHREAQAFSLPPPHIDPWIIERELREYDAASRIFVPSEAALASFIRRGLPVEKLRVIRYGVDLAAFTPPTIERTAAKDRVTVVSVGRVELQKGVQYLVAAFRAARSEHHCLRLVGPADPAVCARLRIPDSSIEVVGAVPRQRVVEELQGADIFSLFSVHEGLPLSMLQAMACGLPILVSQTVGNGVIQEGNNGYVVPDRDVATLTARLSSLFSNSGLRLQMGASARRSVDEMGGWKAYGARLFEEYSALFD